MDTPYTINLNNLGIQINKDITHHLGLYELHKAGSTHGTGLFAKRNIEKNEEVIRATGPIIGPEVESTLYLSYGIDIFIQIGLNKWVLPNNECRFLNHSCEPNMGFRKAGVFVAMRKVKAGEELTFDYSISEIGKDFGSDWVMDCLCNSKLCRKQISNVDIFNPKYKLYEKYKGYLPKFVLKELAEKGLV